jgi:hypothetical protein
MGLNSVPLIPTLLLLLEPKFVDRTFTVGHYPIKEQEEASCKCLSKRLPAWNAV